MYPYIKRPSYTLSFMQQLLKLRAVKALILTAILWLTVFAYCRHAFWRDPHSAFFNDRHVYDLKYSLYREYQARHFIAPYNSRSEPPDALTTTKGGDDPFICAAVVTVKRDEDDYFEASIGSLLQGLDGNERRALRLNVLFADTDPERHPSWGQRWVGRLVDRVGGYGNLSGEELGRLREVERQRNFYVKGVFDYVYALKTCQASNAPYTLVLEDDIILADGWMVKTIKALLDLANNNNKNKKPWIYLRLFYTETSLGWEPSDFAYRNMPLVFGLVIFLSFLCLTGIRRIHLLHTRNLYPDPLTILVLCLITVPAFTALVYMTGKYNIMPLTGVVEMNSHGCCTQALLFPREQVDGLIQYLEGRGHGQTDGMIEEYADQTGLTRYALAPQLLQHVGLKSSRDNTEINTRSTWAFWFEGSDPVTLREEHWRLLGNEEVKGVLKRYG